MEVCELVFDRKDEAISFCDFLMEHNKEIEINWKHNQKSGNLLSVNITETEIEKWILRGLINVFVKHREANWIKEILRDCYYYQDDAEINHILSIIQTVFDGEFEDGLFNSKIRKTYLHDIFFNELNIQKLIQFDSIITFRMHRYKEELIELVGYGIDEYKREEEYQLFINTLRNYLEEKESNCNHIYLLQHQNGQYNFYLENGYKLTKMNLIKIVKEEPLYIFGLDMEELVLSPLIALAPQTISFYHENPTEPKLLTILNIFQERVSLLPANEFPFRSRTKF